MGKNIFNNKENYKEKYEVDVVSNISREEFYSCYVSKGRPVIIKNAAENWRALTWDLEYFSELGKFVPVKVKKGDVSKGAVENVTLGDYIDSLISVEKNQKAPITIPYLHDYPIFNVIPSLIKDVQPFPLKLLPKWYWKQWSDFIQFFIGPANSLTPLHFDTLCTHNLFFQIAGSKKFTLVPAQQKKFCYMYNWRWAKVNPKSLDLHKYPLFSSAVATEVIVKPGDILYIPSCTLHQVESLSFSISFNIDWHTRRSVIEGMLSILRGAPIKNVYYNFIIFVGLWFKVPCKYIFSLYKSYLSYVS